MISNMAKLNTSIIKLFSDMSIYHMSKISDMLIWQLARN
jgi:hypothetical protein